MTKGVSARQQAEDRLRLRRKQRDEAASALVLAKKPVPAIPVASRAKRAPASLPAHRYPVRKASLGDRQAVGPIGRESK
jgi:hypothetical protein